jgi:hypothetical protein
MGIEPLFGILTWLVVTALVHVYLRYFRTDVPRVPGFERYCEGGPLVLAVFSPGVGADAVLDRLRTLLDARGVVDNFRGVHPWPHYRYRVELRRLGDHVVGVYLAGCSPRRGDPPPLPDLANALARLLESPELCVDQFWVHHQFYTEAAPPDAAPETGWQGRIDEERGLVLSCGSDWPLWLRPAMRGAKAA